MSTYTSEPGTRLAGRYRLVDQVDAGSGWTMWKAMDETLARHVTVLTFAPGFPRVREVVMAARAASRLTDPRLTQVFDVEDTDEAAYVVMEWVAGDTLTDMLADGPLDSGRACALVADAASALAGAHSNGVAHLRLTPRSLRWTHGSGLKITGLGIDAALAGDALTGEAAADPALTDTRDLAALLYAALTGYWPGESQTDLPPAPLSEGVICTPRQISADVPAGIDAVVCRALLQRAARQEPPIETPADLADHLADVAPPVPLPEPAPPTWNGASSPHGTAAMSYASPDDPANWALPDPSRGGGPASYRRRHAGTERSVAARGIISVVIVLVLAAIATTAWVLSTSTHTSAGSMADQHSASGKSSSSAPAVQVLKPVSANTFDIFGTSGNEDEQRAHLAIDGNPSTAWATEFYLGSPKFGGLKPGTGLILDMGRQVRLSQVTVLFSAACCTTADIYVGNSNAMSKTALSNFTRVTPASSVSGSHTYTINSSATGRYVLIWLTSLPPMQGNGAGRTFQGLIYEVTVRGTQAAGTG